MIDIHSHLLPELDDGAASIDVSIAMLDALARLGFTTVVATPHLTEPLTDAYADAVGLALAAVRPLAAARGIELVRGVEVRLTPVLPESGWPHDLDEVLFNVQASGFRPVLAHPERYPMLQRRPRYGRELAERGVVLQVTIASFAGAFGRRARKAAEALLREGAVHIVATDAHSADHRLAAVPAGLKRTRQLASDEGVQHLAAGAPESIVVQNDPLSPIEVPKRPGLVTKLAGLTRPDHGKRLRSPVDARPGGER